MTFPLFPMGETENFDIWQLKCLVCVPSLAASGHHSNSELSLAAPAARRNVTAFHGARGRRITRFRYAVTFSSLSTEWMTLTCVKSGIPSQPCDGNVHALHAA